jgi:lipoprotein-releasing system ATP-binding protein
MFTLFRRSKQDSRCAVLLVTHDERISSACDRVVRLDDGLIVADT